MQALMVLLALWALTTVTYACSKDRKSIVLRQPNMVTYACADKSGRWQGLVVVKDAKGTLLSLGRYRNGKPEGVWTMFWKGKVVSHPLFHNGEMISEDTMTDAEAGGGDDD